MKKLFINAILLISLLLNTACDSEDVATAVGVGAGLVFIASIDAQDYSYRNGSYYYRTPSCNRNYEYLDASGYRYYPNDCINSNGKYYVTFGTMLALGLLIYK